MVVVQWMMRAFLISIILMIALLVDVAVQHNYLLHLAAFALLDSYEIAFALQDSAELAAFVPMVLLHLRRGKMSVVQSKMLVLQAFSTSIILMIALLVDVAVRILSY